MVWDWYIDRSIGSSVLLETLVVAAANVTKVGALVCFVVIGIDVFFVMQSIGEMATLYPSTGAFTEMAGRFVDGAVATALGWNYWSVAKH